MHVHYRNCSSPLKINCKKTNTKTTKQKFLLCGVLYCAIVIFQIKYMWFGSKKMFLFFLPGSLVHSTGAAAPAAFFTFPCISNSRANYSFCFHLPLQGGCAGVTKYSLATSSPCSKRELRSGLPAVMLALKNKQDLRGENQLFVVVYAWGTGLVDRWTGGWHLHLVVSWKTTVLLAGKGNPFKWDSWLCS